MTFLMAYIEDIRRIIIFSVTPVNREFNKYVAKYKRRNGNETEVEVYDDNALETLIFECKKKSEESNDPSTFDFSKYFPNCNKANPTGHCITRPSVEYDSEIRTHSAEKRKGNLAIASLGDVIEIILYVNNPYNSSINVELEFDETACNPFMTAIDSAENHGEAMSIGPHTTTCVTRSYRVEKYARSLPMPDIKCVIDGIKENVVKPKNVECRWLAEVPLMGEQYMRAVELATEHVRATDLTCVSIVGRSGTGKSRVIEEIAIRSMQHKIHVVSFDTDNDAIDCNQFARRIVSGVSKLPLFQEQPTNSLFEDNGSPEGNMARYAAHILYDPSFDARLESGILTDYLGKSLQETPLLIAIDNVQNLDETSLGIINGIIDYVGNCSPMSSIVLGINTDFVFPGTAAAELRKRLKRLSLGKPSQACQFELDGFTKDQARLYLRSCLGITESDVLQYEESIRKMVDRHGTEPLYLQQFLLYLRQKGVIRRTDYASFYIADPNRFQEELLRMPAGVRELIGTRHRLLLETVANGHSFDAHEEKHTEARLADESKVYLCELRNILFLISFMKRLPVSIAHHLFPNARILSYLEEAGFCKWDDFGEGYIFYHEQYERYYRKLYPASAINDEFLKRFVEAIEKLGFEERYITPYFIARFILGDMTQSCFSAMLSKVVSRCVEPGLESECFPALISLFQQMEISVEQQAEIHAAIDAMLEPRKGISACIPYDERLLSLFEADTESFAQSIPSAAKVLEDYLVRLINAKEVKKSLDINKRLLALTEEKCTSFNGCEKFCMQLLNRQSMAYNAIGEFKSSEEANRRSLEIARNLDDADAIINALRGAGDIYYCMPDAREHNEKTAEYWVAAYNAYVAEYGESLDSNLDTVLKASTYSKALLANLLVGNYREARRINQFVQHCLNHTGNTYYEIHLRQSSALLLLSDCLAGDVGCLEELKLLVDKAVDLSAIYGRWKDVVRSTHLLALVFLAQHSSAKFTDALLDSLDNTLNSIETEFEYRCWEHFLVESCYLCRLCGKEIPLTLMRKIKDRQVREQVRRINSMSDADFANYRSTFHSEMPITSADGLYGFPQCSQ